MSDLISRQDVFDMIDAVFREECEKRNTTYEEADEITQWYLCGMMKVMEKVFDIPSASRWIPVSERLPKLNDDGSSDPVLLCWADRQIVVGFYAGNETFYAQSFPFATDGTARITAWMPLPDPYKEEER